MSRPPGPIPNADLRPWLRLAVVMIPPSTIRPVAGRVPLSPSR